MLTLGVLVSIGVNLVTLSRAGKSQKREVTFGEEFVSKEFCHANHDVIQQRMARLEASVEKDRGDASESRRALYQELGKVRVELSQKIDEMPAQIIVILKNTGAIK